MKRRGLLKDLSSICVGTTLLPPFTFGQANRSKDQLIFLGTQGGPNYNLARGESSSVLVIKNRSYLVDCGYGTLRALLAAKIPYLDIGHIFLTHLHDDHIADVAALVGHQWTQGRVLPTDFYGPYGTDALVKAAVDFNAANTRIRLADEARSLLPKDLFKGTNIIASDLPITVFEDDNVKVLAAENSHYPTEAKQQMPDRSLAFRFDSEHRSVVFSGDTTYSENLIKLAERSDILVCEAMDVKTMRNAFDAMVAKGGYGDNPEGIWKHIVETHTTTADAGRMAAAAKVGTLAINHLVPGALQDVDDNIYIDVIAKYYSGNIVVSKDQMIL